MILFQKWINFHINFIGECLNMRPEINILKMKFCSIIKKFRTNETQFRFGLVLHWWGNCAQNAQKLHGYCKINILGAK